MSCDHQILTDHVWAWIEGSLSPEQSARCEDAVRHCAQCRDSHAQALEFHQLAARWQEQQVPHWNRARFAIPPARPARGVWLNLGALAASLTAIFLVLLRVEISTTNGLWISLGGSQTEARVQELLADELARYTAAQELLVETRLTEFAADQLNANQLLLARWQESGRAERRQELGFLMSSWQAQRFQDQQEFNNQLNQLTNSQIENTQYLNALMQNVTLNRRNGL
jgi:hypothetical protein